MSRLGCQITVITRVTLFKRRVKGFIYLIRLNDGYTANCSLTLNDRYELYHFQGRNSGRVRKGRFYERSFSASFSLNESSRSRNREDVTSGNL